MALPLAITADVQWALIALSAISAVLATLWAIQQRANATRRAAELERLEHDLLLTTSKLVAQRNHFDQFERIAKIGTWSSDLATRTLEASAGYLEIYEVSLDEMPFAPERYIAKFVDDDDERRSANENVAKLRRGEPIDAIRKIRVGSGKHKYIHIRSEPRTNSEGKLLGYDGVVRDITEEHMRELELAKTTMLLREVHQIAKIGHFYWEIVSDRLLVSDDYYTTFGIVDGQAIQTMQEWVDKLYHPDDMSEVEANLRRIAKGEPYNVIRRSRASDGEFRFIEINAVPVFDKFDALIAYRGTVRDVTEQQTNLARLAENKARLDASQDGLLRAQRLAKIGSWRLDLATQQMEYSPEYLNLLDMTPETAPQTAEQWVDRFVTDADDAARVRLRFKDAVANKESYAGIRSIVRRDGTRRWLSYAADPVIGDDGRAIAFVGATRDITEEYVAREELAASEERFRMISENMQDIVTLHDAAGKLIYASPSLYRQLGHVPGKTANNMPYEYLHPDDVQVAKHALESLQQNRVPSTKIEYRIRKRGGEYAWVETNFVRVVQRDQSLSHFQAVTRDITDRKSAEQALAKRTDELSVTNKLLVEEAARRQALERRVLLSIESALGQVGLELHDDLGQQLTGIALLAKTLEHKLTSHPPQAERSTAHEAARISELVNRAINHTRMISHGLSPYIGGENGLSDALAQLANDIDSLGVVSCVAEVDASVEVNDEVAARSLYRIAQEATNNALKHSGASLIRISLKMVGADLQLTIGDDGLRNISALENGPHSGQIVPSLYSIRHRAQAIGARVAFRHFAGKGTFVCIRWQVPLRPYRPVNAQLAPVSRAA